MDTKKINALLTVVRNGSLSSAAQELGYSQPGLTNMMNSLEDEIGLSLLERGKSGVKLTASGQKLLEKMLEFHRVGEELETAVNSIKNANSNTLRIGAITSTARNWIPEIVVEYRKKRPDSEILVQRYDVLSESYDAVLRGETDCAVVSYIDDHIPGLERVALYEDEMIAVLPPTYSGFSPVTPDYFDGREFLMPSGGLDIDILPFFEGTGCHPLIRYSNLDDPTIVSMVSHGLGTSILSRLIMQGINEPVQMISLGPASFRHIGIIYKTERSKDRSILEFVNTARSLVGL